MSALKRDNPQVNKFEQVSRLGHQHGSGPGGPLYNEVPYPERSGMGLGRGTNLNNFHPDQFETPIILYPKTT